MPIPTQKKVYVPPQPVKSPTPTTAPTPTPGLWSPYTNEQWGFQFETPTVYLDPLPGRCGLRETAASDLDLALYQVGNRSTLAIRKWDGSSLDTLADQALEALAGTPDYSETSRQSRAIAGEPALEIEYRFGGNTRYGTAAFLIRESNAYIFNMTAGGFCDFPDKSITERAAYARMIDTFMINP